ncbi:Membrane-fusion protein [Rhodopirellula maiorica SM1]|uniref:Membrane-fusion protein n=1 Tax=Rhodopirellula maiorica SM1 TaxID=1265738 RepID=M5RS47_9BACT|nr:Membrane-fusion protein [Rhodopirellula maiorica SM1]
MNIVVSIAILAGCLFGYTLLGERKRPARSKPNKPAATAVTTEALQRHQGPLSISSNGVVVPLREIRLATEVAGRVIEQSENLRPGREVSEGETLIQLDPTEYELEVRRLAAQKTQEDAELAAADVNIENTAHLLTLAEEQVRLASGERERTDALVARQAASVSEVEVAKRAELTAKSALVELQNRERELIAQRTLILRKQALTEVAAERAKLDLSRTTVRSPIRGRVVQSGVEEQSFIAAGTSFVTIEDTTAIEVRSNLTVDQMYWVWNSAAMANQFESGDHGDRVPPVSATIQYRLGKRVYQWQAVLTRIDGAGIDLDTRTYPCLLRVDSPADVVAVDADASQKRMDTPPPSPAVVADGPRRLMRGMFVSVTLNVHPTRTLYRVNEIAIRPGNRIWLDVDGKLRVVPVEVVSRMGDGVIVDADIDSALPTKSMKADHVAVIVSPVSDPKDGMPVMTSGTTAQQPGSTPTRIADDVSGLDSAKAAG